MTGKRPRTSRYSSTIKVSLELLLLDWPIQRNRPSSFLEIAPFFPGIHRHEADVERPGRRDNHGPGRNRCQRRPDLGPPPGNFLSNVVQQTTGSVLLIFAHS